MTLSVTPTPITLSVSYLPNSRRRKIRALRLSCALSTSFQYRFHWEDPLRHCHKLHSVATVKPNHLLTSESSQFAVSAAVSPPPYKPDPFVCYHFTAPAVGPHNSHSVTFSSASLTTEQRPIVAQSETLKTLA